MPIERESGFNILKNGMGQLMILIHAHMGGVRTPKIVYDGGQAALLYRTNSAPVLLDFIHPAIRRDLRGQNEVLVVETDNGAIIREYTTMVQVVPTLPLIS